MRVVRSARRAPVPSAARASLLAVLLAFAAVAIAQPSDVETIDRARLFAEASHVLGHGRNPAARWSGAVRFVVIGTADEFLLSMTSAVFDEIALLSGIEIERLDSGSEEIAGYLASADGAEPAGLAVCDPTRSDRCANFVVLLTERRAMGEAAEALRLRSVYRRAIDDETAVPCFFAPSVVAGRDILRAVVFVDATQELSMINACLHEEVYQAFGLFNDRPDSRYFSFDDVVASKHTTLFDRALLTALYADRSQPAAGVADRFARDLSARIALARSESRRRR